MATYYFECFNCHATFETEAELNSRVPPNPPLPLTRQGDAALFNNQVQEANYRVCTACGNRTLQQRRR